MKKITDIHLSFPCQQDWQAMKPSEQNRICTCCLSCAYDFTNTTSGELTEILNNSSGVICGKFKKSQLSKIFIKYAATTFIAAAFLTIPAIGQEMIKTDSVHQATDQIEEEAFLGIIAEKQAVPKIGFEELIEKINQKLRYPDQLVEGGKVYIQFTVDTAGNMVDAEVIKGLNEIADKEALRAFRSVDEKFEPARQRGKVVRMRIVIPITFDLIRIKMYE